MTGELEVEATGETVGEAKWIALRELERRSPGLDKGAVQFEVVSEGERGLLGVGYAPARVIASVEAAEAVLSEDPAHPKSHTEGSLAAEARDLVGLIARGIGVPCAVRVSEDEATVLVECTGRDLGSLIGKHGQTIDAVQYLVNAIVARSHGNEGRKDVVVDAAGYRERRRVTLEALALQAAERALAERSAVALESMTAVERKVVHLRLKEHPGIVTTSEGTEPNRHVVVALAGA